MDSNLDGDDLPLAQNKQITKKTTTSMSTGDIFIQTPEKNTFPTQGTVICTVLSRLKPTNALNDDHRNEQRRRRHRGCWTPRSAVGSRPWRLSCWCCRRGTTCRGRRWQRWMSRWTEVRIKDWYPKDPGVS